MYAGFAGLKIVSKSSTSNAYGAALPGYAAPSSMQTWNGMMTKQAGGCRA